MSYVTTCKNPMLSIGHSEMVDFIAYREFEQQLPLGTVAFGLHNTIELKKYLWADKFYIQNKDGHNSMCELFMQCLRNRTTITSGLANIIINQTNDQREKFLNHFVSNEIKNFETALYVFYNQLFTREVNDKLISPKFIMEIDYEYVLNHHAHLFPYLMPYLTPLHPELKNSDIVHRMVDKECVNRLVETKHLFDFNYVDKVGNTPLMRALKNGNHGSAKILLEVPEVDVNIPDAAGNTPIMVATKPYLVDKIIKHPSYKPTATTAPSTLSRFEQAVFDAYDSEGNKFTTKPVRDTVVRALSTANTSFKERIFVLPAGSVITFVDVATGRTHHNTFGDEIIITVATDCPTIAHLIGNIVVIIKNIVTKDHVQIESEDLYKK